MYKNKKNISSLKQVIFQEKKQTLNKNRKIKSKVIYIWKMIYFNLQFRF